METISVVVSAYNEEAKIKHCLASVKWADEIILVDSSSTDKTVSFAQEFTSKIFHRPNNPMLNANKNYGFTKATSDWIISLDADEEIPQELASEIKSKIKTNSGISGYWITRKNIIFGKWIRHGLWWPDKQLRLFRKGSGKFPEKHVHEYLQVDGQTETLSQPFVHLNYETISQFIRKMDAVYSENEVLNLKATNYQLAWYDAIRFPVSDFVKIFFAQKGYLDGLHGLVLAFFQAFYSFVVFAKLWESEKFRERDINLVSVSEELDRSKQEIRYWILSSKIQETDSLIKKIWFKIARRMRKIF